MSSTERNKGRLIPTGVDTELFREEDFEMYEENGFLVIDGEIYEVEFEVERSDDLFFSDVKVDDETGIINFHTVFFNGATSLNEMIEQELMKL